MSSGKSYLTIVSDYVVQFKENNYIKKKRKFFTISWYLVVFFLFLFLCINHVKRRHFTSISFYGFHVEENIFPLFIILLFMVAKKLFYRKWGLSDHVISLIMDIWCVSMYVSIFVQNGFPNRILWLVLIVEKKIAKRYEEELRGCISLYKYSWFDKNRTIF